MDCTLPSRVSEHDRLSSGDLVPWLRSRTHTDETGFNLPILDRSAAFLSLLLQDGAIDLELASSVIALDPGLAYGTLRLANGNLPETCDRIWQLPLAVVTAGRDALQHLLDTSIKIGLSGEPPCAQLRQVMTRAVERGCVAQYLAREAGCCHPKKTFLAGLLLELPILVQMTEPSLANSPATLFSSMCRTLPAPVVRAALVQHADEATEGDPLVALVLIADAVIQARSSPEPAAWLEELSCRPVWLCLGEMPQLQRARMLGGGCEMAAWAVANCERIAPWNFMSRLERLRAWE